MILENSQTNIGGYVHNSCRYDNIFEKLNVFSRSSWSKMKLNTTKNWKSKNKSVEIGCEPSRCSLSSVSKFLIKFLRPRCFPGIFIKFSPNNNSYVLASVHSVGCNLSNMSKATRNRLLLGIQENQISETAS